MGDRLTRRAALAGLAGVGSLALAGCRSLDPRGTSPEWRHDIEGAAGAGPPAFVDGRLVLGAQDRRLHVLDTDGNHAFAVETGGPIETRPAVPDSGGPYHVHSTDGDRYAVSTGGEPLWVDEGQAARGRCFRAGSLVVALDLEFDLAIGYDADTGEERFRTPARAYDLPGLTDSLVALPTPAGGDQVRLTVYDHDGRVHWEAAPTPGYPRPVTDDGRLVARGNGALVRYDPADGSVRWRTETDDLPEHLSLGGDLYYTTRGRGGELDTVHALSGETGEPRFEREVGYNVRTTLTREDAVFVASAADDPDGGVLARVDRFAPDGTREWQTTVETPWFEDLLAVGGLLFGVADRQLVALDAATGAVRWRHEPDSASRLAAVAGPDAVYVSYRDDGAVGRFSV